MVVGLLVAGLALATAPAVGSGSEPSDRLERFRSLAAARLAALEISGQEPTPDVLGEIYALLDDEILDSLRGGGPFASEGFLQERLDAFNEAWGGTAFRVLALGGGLTVGAFQLSPSGRGSSVRVYGPSGPRAALVRAIHHPGVPALREMPPTRQGEPQFLAAWVGSQSSRGTTALRLELWRKEGESVGLAWSTDALSAGDLFVGRFAVDARQVSLRYEVRYPGWKPGCDGQTEHEDAYRYVAGRETFVLARRQVVNAWHRDVHAVLGRVLSALRSRDERALAGLVADAGHVRLPARLEPDLACDEADGPSPTTVGVAAVEPPGPGGDAAGRPWTLVFRRTPAGWRLTSAAPIR